MSSEHLRESATQLCRTVRAVLPLLRLLTVRQVVHAGDAAINAAGLNPYCMNEGRATGDEPISTDSIERAIKEVEDALSIRTFGNLKEARDYHDSFGGWLLDLPDQPYIVTEDEAVVRAIRGEAYIEECERTQVWDETDDAHHTRASR